MRHRTQRPRLVGAERTAPGTAGRVARAGFSPLAGGRPVSGGGVRSTAARVIAAGDRRLSTRGPPERAGPFRRG